MVYLIFAMIAFVFAFWVLILNRAIGINEECISKLTISIYELQCKFADAEAEREEFKRRAEEEQRKALKAEQLFSDGVANILGYEVNVKRGDTDE